MPPMATRRPRRSRTRSSSITVAGTTGSPTGSWSRRRTTRPRMVASSTTRPTAARPTRTPRAGSRTRRTACSRPISPVCSASRSTSRAPRRPAHDFIGTYVDDLANVIDMEAIRGSGLRLGVDPLGGASVAYWSAIAERYGLDLTVTNDVVDPTVRIHDLRLGRAHPDGPVVAPRDGIPGRAARPVRCRLRQRHRCRPTRDRDARCRTAQSEPLPGGGDRPPVRRRAGLGPGRRRRQDARLERDDRSRHGRLGRRLVEVPVGFKWFVDGLVDGSLGFGGEESAGASFLRRDGTVWTTDKDGIIACLLAAELTARSDRDPGVAYAELTERFGAPAYRRIDAPATPAQKAVLARLSPIQVTASRTGRRHGHGDPHDGAGQRCRDRRAQGRDRPGLVRRPTLGHGERLQDLRRELSRRRPPRPDHR